MKKMSIIQKRVLAMGLAVSLVAGGVLGYNVFYKNSSASDSENEKMEAVMAAFNQKRSEVMSEASEDLVKNCLNDDNNSNNQKSNNKSKNKETRIIIQLKGKPAVDKVKDTSDTDKMVKSEEKVLDAQEKIIKKVEKITGNKIENQTGCLINSIVINANSKEIKKIKKLDEVKCVAESQYYEAEDITETLDYTIDDYKQISKALEDETGITAVRNKEGYYTGKSTVVAVIDTGVNYEHKDMKLDKDVTPKFSKEEWESKIAALGYGKYYSEKVPFGYDYINNNDEVLASNDYHGYHVSGITGGNGDLLGVAPNTQIVGLKTLGDNGGHTDQIVRAIEDAVKLGVDVINMSLGSDNGVVEDDTLKSKAIKKAMESGIICCIAAGNAATTDGDASASNKYKLMDTATINSPGTTKEAMTVASAYISGFGTDISKVMSFYSSWGPTNDLKLKPEITAPGQYIFAAFDGVDNYDTLSGTSMATPFVAGCSTLLLNDIEKNNIKSFENKNEDLQGEELALYMKNNLMNTSEPIMDTKSGFNSPYSVRRQGAGLVNINSALNNRVIATCNGEAKIELGEVDGSASFDIVLRNYGDKDKTYTIEGSEIYEPYSDGKEVYCIKPSGSGRISASGQVTVPAYEETVVSCSVNVSGCAKNSFAEGFVTFKGEDTPNLSLPLLAFNGDWSAEPIIDKSVYDEGEGYLEKNDINSMFNPKKLVSNTCLIGQTRAYGDAVLGMKLGETDEQISYDGELNAFSPNNDYIMDEVYAGVTQLRNAYEIKFNVLNKDKEIIRTVGTAYLAERSTLMALSSKIFKQLAMCSPGGYQNILSWDGKIYDESKDEYVLAEDGQYYIQLASKISKNSKAQIINMPIKIDTKKPTIVESMVSKEGSSCYYLFKVQDDLALEDHMYVYVDGEVKEYKYSELECDKDGYILLDIGDIQDKEAYALFTDVAGNETLENIQKVKEDDNYISDNNIGINAGDYDVTVKCDQTLVKDMVKNTYDNSMYILLNENVKDKFEFDVVCDENYPITKATVSGMGTGGGIDDSSDSREEIEGVLNSDGSVHFTLDNSLDWMFMNLSIETESNGAIGKLLQVYKASDEESYHFCLSSQEQSRLFCKLNEQFIDIDKLDKDGMYTYKGKMFVKPDKFTVNGTNIEVNPDTLEYEYKFKPVYGKNIININVKNYVQEYSSQITTYMNDMEVELDLPQSDGVIKTDKSSFKVSGTIRSYITGYSVYIKGNRVFTDIDFMDLDSSRNDIDEKKFSYDVNLKSGENIITVKVTNHLDQVVIKKIKVIYEN